MTFAEKILKGKAGQTVRFECSRIVVNDADYPAISENGGLKEADANKLIMFVDHIVPAINEQTDEIQTAMRSYAKQHGNAYYEGKGIGYLILTEELLKKQDIVCGVGKHMGTTGAVGALGIRFTPEELAAGMKDGCFSIEIPETIKIQVSGVRPAGKSVRDAFFTCVEALKQQELSHTILEIGGSGLVKLSTAEKAEICAVLTMAEPWSVIINEEELESAEYKGCIEVNLSTAEEKILAPKEPPILVDGEIKIKSAFVGGCAGGSIEDIRIVADILRGKKVKDFLRFLVCPSTQECYLQAISEGLIEDLLESGAMVANPHCCTCYGKTQGKIEEGENMISTGLCNAAGTAGSSLGNIYLASPEVVAKTVLRGYISKEEA